MLLTGAMFLTGCSNNSSNEGGSTASSSSPGASQTISEPVNLSWFSDVAFWNPPSPWSTDPNTVQGAITKKTGLTFDFNIPAQDGGTKLSLMLVSSDKLPDLISVTDEKLIKKLIDSNKVWKLDQLLEKYDPDSPLLKSSFFPEDVKQALIARDGAWYAYPSHMSSEDSRELLPPSSSFFSDAVKYRNNGAIMFNKQILEQAGLTIDDVKTEDGVLAAFKKVQGMKFNGSPVIPLQIDGKIYAKANIGGLPGSDVGTLGTLEMMFGAMPVDKDGNYRDLILAPETKHAIDFLYKAVKDGDFDASQMTIDSAAVKATVKSGRVFAFIGNSAGTGFSDIDTVTDWISSGPILSNQNTKPAVGMSKKAGWWQSLFISKDAPHPELIAKWLDFMTSDEGLKLHYYGFEGKDYTLDENGLVVQTQQGLDDSANYQTTGVFSMWPFHNGPWHDHVTAPPKNVKGADSIEAMQVQTELGKGSEIYDTSALMMPNDFITAGSELATKQLQMNAYLEAQVSKMILSKDAASRDKTYEETVAKLKQMGLDEIDAKINDQFQKQQQSSGTTLKGINS